MRKSKRWRSICRAFSLACGLHCGLSADLARADAEAPPQTRVPQAGRGGVLDWVVLDDSQLLLQTRDRQWYRVRLFMPSWGLASAQSLGFITGPDGALAAGGQLLIGGQRYPVVSVTVAEAPARRR